MSVLARRDLEDSRHLRRVRRELASRRELVAAMLLDAGLVVHGDRAGAHVAVLLHDVDTERRLVTAARSAGVLLDGLQRCFAGPPSLAGVTIGYAAPAHRADVERALRAIVQYTRGA